jgi:molybdopterin molybdotransferase
VSIKNDCFSAGDNLMLLEDALKALKEKLAPVVGKTNVPLQESLGRILAENIVSPRMVPPHDNAAVDGYAVRFCDLNQQKKTPLPIAGRIAAGHPLGRAARPGEAFRIFTGAPVPEGCDTVFMQEDCVVDGDDVVLPEGIKKGANRRFAGEDVKQGDVVIKRGQRLRPQEVGLAASVGCSEVAVYQKLRAAVFSTGDEVRDPAQDAPEGCIFDANRYTVMGLLRGLGCEVTDLGILPDKFEEIRAALAKAASGHHILLTSGGVSVGDEDHVKAAVEALGSLNFWRLAIKPGRPIALGQIEKASFVGLPGNPVAAMVTFMRIARPVVLLLSGQTQVDPALFKVRSAFSHSKKPGRREWLRGRLERNADGTLLVKKYRSDGSGILSSMVESDGLIELPEDMGPFDEEEMVDFLPFSEVTQ